MIKKITSIARNRTPTACTGRSRATAVLPPQLVDSVQKCPTDQTDQQDRGQHLSVGPGSSVFGPTPVLYTCTPVI